MGNTDYTIPWRRKRVYLGIIESTEDLAVGTDLAVVDSTYIMGHVVADAEYVNWGWKIPYDLDPAWEIGFKVHFHTSTGGTTEWILLWQVNKAAAGLLIGSLAALSTIIGSESATADKNSWSPRGILISSTLSLSDAEVDAGVVMQLNLEAQDIVATCNVMGIEIDYVPRLTRGPNSAVDGPLDDAV